MRKNPNKLFVFSILNLIVALSGATLAMADNAAPVAAQPQPGFASMMVPFLLMFAVIYFLMIRPQQKKMKEQQAMMSQLKQGDEIITNAGILGKVAGITDKVVTVEVADNVRVKMLKSQVATVIKGQQFKDLA
jgi:preprotein translocase subunit YajC